MSLAAGAGGEEADHRLCPQNLVRWCDSAPCKNGGKCWQTNTQYHCECRSGWTGLNCDVLSVSCEVAAQKRGERPSPVCTRPWLNPGEAYRVRRTWTVALEAAAQASAPSHLVPTGIDVTLLCQHGGLCVDEEDKHYCHCQAGYTGSYCEDEVDECSPNPCQNGATCTDYLGGFSCKVWTVPGVEGRVCA